MSVTERRKGAVAEREVIWIFRQHGWTQAERTSDGRAQASRGDIAHGPAGAFCEIKRQERLNVPAAVRRMLLEAPRGAIPVLIHRPSRCDWIASLPLEELLPLLRLREAA